MDSIIIVSIFRFNIILSSSVILCELGGKIGPVRDCLRFRKSSQYPSSVGGHSVDLLNVTG